MPTSSKRARSGAVHVQVLKRQARKRHAADRKRPARGDGSLGAGSGFQIDQTRWKWRVSASGALLIHYGLATPYLSRFWGDSGWMPSAPAPANDTGPNRCCSILTRPWQWVLFHGVFLSCCLGSCGLADVLVKWIVMIGQISFEHRNPFFFYGVDNILPRC